MSARRVAVIGAGVSGLVSLRWLRVEGLDAVAFERTGELGGIWNAGPGWPSYRSLVANVSREKTSLSDHPLRSPRDFPTRAEVHGWIVRYAERHGLREHIRSHHTVRAVEPRWTVDGERFDAVVVASGMFTIPRMPAFAGSFDGLLYHAIDHDAPDALAGRRVVVVGAGSTAADLAVELAEVAASVSLSVRGSLVVTPKTIRGRPIDRLQTRWLRLLPPARRGALIRRAILGEWRRRGVDLARLPARVGLVPAPGRAPTPSEELLPALVDGRVRLRPAIARLAGHAVEYADGAREPADAIICATGYELAFPFLPRALWPLRDGRLELYRHVFHPDEPTLAFVGFVRVSGPVPPIAEMQARWVARVLAGRASLSSTAEMHAEIDGRVARAHATGAELSRVQYVDHLDELGALIGARPSLWRRPWLLWSTVTAEQYR